MFVYDDDFRYVCISQPINNTIPIWTNKGIKLTNKWMNKRSDLKKQQQQYFVFLYGTGQIWSIIWPPSIEFCMPESFTKYIIDNWYSYSVE